MFLWFHDANPAVIDREHLEKRSGGIGEGQKTFVEAAAALADDVVICLDAETGQLVWETRFPSSMANNQEHKQGINNHTPAYANGMVFALTGTMRLIALDAGTGELRWQAPAGDVKRYEKIRDEAARDAKYLGGKFAQRGYGRAPLPLGDMVLVSVGDEVRAYDAATGEVRWKAEKATEGNDDLGVWTRGEREYVVGASPRGITILDPADGSVVYKLDVQADPWDTSPAIVGDLLVTPGHLAGEDKKEVASGYHAFRLGDSAAEHLWSVREGDADLELGLGSQITPIIRDGKVYLGGQGGLIVLDADTGRVLQNASGPGLGDAGHLLAAGEDRILLNQDGGHGYTRLAFYSLDGEKITPPADGSTWAPQLPSVTSYHHWMTTPIVDGRLFIRGREAVLCYDLRKLQP